jgi:mRNA (guanine-N7-)-methyltransferase
MNKNLYDQAAAMDTGSSRDSGPGAKLKTFHNDIKKLLYQTFAPNVSSLLDLGCGRGGDIHKWKHSGIKFVKAIDLSPMSIEEAKNRYSKMKSPGELQVHFETMDLRFSQLHNLGVFDAVSCMFAFHYFFESEDILRNVLSNISSHLKSNGFFFGCVARGVNVLTLLNNREEFKSSCLQITRHQEEPKCFGSMYQFTLQDTVTEETSHEYLVFENVLTEVATDYALVPVLEYPNQFKHMVNLQNLGVLKQFLPNFTEHDFCEASKVFSIFAFRKL